MRMSAKSAHLPKAHICQKREFAKSKLTLMKPCAQCAKPCKTLVKVMRQRCDKVSIISGKFLGDPLPLFAGAAGADEIEHSVRHAGVKCAISLTTQL